MKRPLLVEILTMIIMMLFYIAGCRLPFPN
jgi:hypothetical protein